MTLEVSTASRLDETSLILIATKPDGSSVMVRLPFGTRTVSEHEALLVKLRASYSMLRQWKLDADAAVAAWDGRTVAQNMVVLKVVVQRFGNLADGVADLLQTMNADA